MECTLQVKENNITHSSVKPNQVVKSYPSQTIVHAKLEMTEPDDADEIEAVMASNDIMNGGIVRRQISSGYSKGGVAISSQMESSLNALAGGGRAMPEGLKDMMERGFGRDFSQVRLHTDASAAEMSNDIHAKAFTYGNDIYFNRGQFNPESHEGQKLVAHELTHVVQHSNKSNKINNNILNRQTDDTNEQCEDLSKYDDSQRKSLNMLGSSFLTMEKDEYGNYHAVLDCIQKYFGYMDEYDIVFSYFTSMQRKKFYLNNKKNEKYCLWAWKGDYLNLGIGAELGFYKGDDCDRNKQVCLTDTNLAMEMAVTKLNYLKYNYCIDTNMKNHFWATVFVNRSEDQYSSFIPPLIAKIVAMIIASFATNKIINLMNIMGLGAEDILKLIKEELSKFRNNVDGNLVDSKNIIAEYKIKYKDSQEEMLKSLEKEGWTFDYNNKIATFLFKGEGDPFEGIVTQELCAMAIMNILKKIIPVIFEQDNMYKPERVKMVQDYWGRNTIMGSIGGYAAQLPFFGIIGESIGKIAAAYYLQKRM